eukprot:TRINITY_DN15725_c0_g1_i1.p1 TRINITY_DN15725_c0_g1~~TRINITY_DN15725_c0_g1_i1.p1  ORF type:complete len:429 (+),score=107.43 TRINITY_DN15725_c0_g1_i1:1382-2668(+)
MASRAALFLLAAFAIAVLSVFADTQHRTLVVMDDQSIKDTHSIFFKALTDRGYQLSFVNAEDHDANIAEYGERLYDNLILFAPTADNFGSADVKSVLSFVDAGGNVLIAADSRVSPLIRDIGAAVGLQVEEAGTSVIDHFNVGASDEGDHTLISSSAVIDAAVIYDTKQKPKNILFRGVAMVVDDSSELVIPILTAESTAFSLEPSKNVNEKPTAVGKNAVLVGSLQARNNARVTLSGSLELFSNEFFAGKTAGGAASDNQQFAVGVATWTFQERGLLRGSNIRHHRVGEADAPREYTVEQEIEYEVDIHEWDGHAWRAYTANDVQLDFTRLDPHQRLAMKHNGKGHYSVQFKAPDAYGVFQFKINYHRVGYTNLRLTTATPVRPFRHNQYERFIFGAYPYYLAAFSMMGGFVLFSVVWLYSRPPKTD